MTKRTEMQIYGEPDLRGIVELDDDDDATCVHCAFVNEHISEVSSPGTVVFVHRVDDPEHSIRRIEFCILLGCVALKCEGVTAERAREEVKFQRPTDV